jgi:hypothetical protein
VVWWSVDSDEAVVEEKLGGGNAQALREGEKKRGRCGGKRWRWPPFIGEVRR